MKSLIVVALFAGICAVASAQKEFEVCHKNIEAACSDIRQFNEGAEKCDARYGAIDKVQREVQEYINEQLHKSFEYLLLATNFDSHQKDRPGFQKLYQSLSDRSFDDTIDLIKHLTRRGGQADIKAPEIERSQYDKYLVNELHSLGLALDMEKQLAHGANHLHLVSSHVHVASSNSGERKYHDPELAHFMEEKFLGKQAETVRKISGYANDLAKLVSVDDSSLSIYLFDEYLQKQ